MPDSPAAAYVKRNNNKGAIIHHYATSMHSTRLAALIANWKAWNEKASQEERLAAASRAEEEKLRVKIKAERKWVARRAGKAAIEKPVVLQVRDDHTDGDWWK